MSAAVPGMDKPAPVDPFKSIKKAWKWSAIVRKPLGLAFIIYGWQQLWRNAQSNEDPFIAFALTEWWHTGIDVGRTVWRFTFGGGS